MNAVALGFVGIDLQATPEGALWWPAEATLLVADLHLEKGSSLARGGTLLPPYDSAATLKALMRLIEVLAPRRVVCLGDSFHDVGGAARLSAADRDILRALAHGRHWLWIAGNHDGEAGFAGLDGEVAAEASLGPLVLRHQAAKAPTLGELSGHFHPKARVAVAGRRITCRCFAGDARRLILPAFGAYAGGLDVFDPAISSLLDPGFTVWMLGRARVHRLPSHRLHRPGGAAAALREDTHTSVSRASSGRSSPS